MERLRIRRAPGGGGGCRGSQGHVGHGRLRAVSVLVSSQPAARARKGKGDRLLPMTYYRVSRGVEIIFNSSSVHHRGVCACVFMCVCVFMCLLQVHRCFTHRCCKKLFVFPCMALRSSMEEISSVKIRTNRSQPNHLASVRRVCQPPCTAVCITSPGESNN